jgi:hypothetical protein
MVAVHAGDEATAEKGQAEGSCHQNTNSTISP